MDGCCARPANSAAEDCSSSRRACATLADTLTSSSEMHRPTRAAWLEEASPSAARMRSESNRKALQERMKEDEGEEEERG